jgi:hypothetical protein
VRSLWDPILFTKYFCFKIQVNNLLAHVSFEISVYITGVFYVYFKRYMGQ